MTDFAPPAVTFDGSTDADAPLVVPRRVGQNV